MNAVTEQPHPRCIRSRVPWDEYRSLPGMNITRLKELRHSAKHYLHAMAHPKRTTALTLGGASHVAVLEPERFSSEFAIWSRRSEKTGNLCPRNGQWWDAFQEENPGRSVITIDEAEESLAIQAAVRSDEVAARYLEVGDPEVTLQWTNRGRPCKGRVDWLTAIDGEPCLVGLKTARDVRPLFFGNQAGKLAYHLQHAWYHDGYEFITGQRPKVVEIVVESAAPYDVVVFPVPDEVIQQGRDEYLVLLDQLEECERANKWPGVARGLEQPLSLPTWIYEANDDISELGLEE